MHTIAVFCMHQRGHLNRLLPLVVRLVRRGATVTVYTAPAFRPLVEPTGAGFADLLGRFPVEACDTTSLPRSMRAIAHAARHADSVIDELRAAGTDGVVYDAFAVLGEVAGRGLGIPWVCVLAGHRADPDAMLAQLHRDGRVRVAPAVEAAAGILRERYGLAHADPFLFMHGRSPWLNLYCEPPAFMTEADRQALEPLACFGSLPDGALAAPPRRDRTPGRLYVSFGTAIWLHYRPQALAALATIAQAVARRQDLQATISLGGTPITAAERAPLTRPNVAVHEFVDQRAVLADADLFVTHHGLNSTHEAIAATVPMLSHPFFFDQPFLARRCQALGLALPLRHGLDEPLDAAQVTAALAAAESRRTEFATCLARARDWERAVMADRDAVADQLLALH